MKVISIISLTGCRDELLPDIIKAKYKEIIDKEGIMKVKPWNNYLEQRIILNWINYQSAYLLLDVG